MSTSTENKKKRALMAKSEMDGHDRGLRYVSSVFEDNGIETKLIRYGTPDDVVKMAIKEKFDVIGISFYSGGVMHDTTEVLKKLKESKREDIPLVIGGTIPEHLIPKLKEMGVARIVGPGQPLDDVVKFILSK